MENAFNNRRNEILTNFETVIKPMAEDYNGIDVSATYYLKSPDQLEAFAAELYGKGLNPIFDVTTDESSYEKIVGPVEGLKSISLAFVIIVLVFGGIIIALLSSIAVRERKYEIGVLRAMGLKKRKVTFGLWMEMLMITCLCLVIGITVGSLVAQPVTDVMLDSQIAAAEEAQNQNNRPQGVMISGRGGAPGQSDAKPLSDIDVSLDFKTFMEIIAIAVLLSSGAVFIATRKITKYEPIKILMERD